MRARRVRSLERWGLVHSCTTQRSRAHMLSRSHPEQTTVGGRGLQDTRVLGPG